MIYKKKIVVLGAGFGGLKTAFSLCKKLAQLKLTEKYEVILIDRYDYHTYYPVLYEIATASKTVANQLELKKLAVIPLKTIFRDYPITTIQKTVIEIQLAEGRLCLENDERLNFDYLVLALGSETNYFDLPGIKENALTLKSFTDAIKIRDKIWNVIDGAPPEKHINIIVGGGGATGVELAGELKCWMKQLEEEKNKKCKVDLAIIEACPTILNGLHPKVIKIAVDRLKKIGVALLTNKIIEKADAKKIILKNGEEIDYDILIWTGGVKPSSVITALPIKKEKRGRPETGTQMECLPQVKDLKLYGKVYAVGDLVCFYDPETNKSLPQIAQIAIHQAKIAAHNIIEDIKLFEGLTKKPSYQSFFPKKEYAYVIPIGGKFAVAKVGPFIFKGLLGWTAKGLVELFYLLSDVLPLDQALKIWLAGLKIFIQNDRLG